MDFIRTFAATLGAKGLRDPSITLGMTIGSESPIYVKTKSSTGDGMVAFLELAWDKSSSPQRFGWWSEAKPKQKQQYRVRMKLAIPYRHEPFKGYISL